MGDDTIDRDALDELTGTQFIPSSPANILPCERCGKPTTQQDREYLHTGCLNCETLAMRG